MVPSPAFRLAFFLLCQGNSSVLCLVAQSCPTLCDPVDCVQPGSSVHGDSPSVDTGVGCHALLLGMHLPNPGLPHCRPILHCLSHQGSWATLRSAFILPPPYQGSLRAPVALRSEHSSYQLLGPRCPAHIRPELRPNVPRPHLPVVGVGNASTLGLFVGAGGPACRGEGESSPGRSR